MATQARRKEDATGFKVKIYATIIGTAMACGGVLWRSASDISAARTESRLADQHQRRDVDALVRSTENLYKATEALKVGQAKSQAQIEAHMDHHKGRHDR